MTQNKAMSLNIFPVIGFQRAVLQTLNVEPFQKVGGEL